VPRDIEAEGLKRVFSEWLNRFRPKVFEEVTNSRLHVILHSEVERLLINRGFEAVDDLKWVRGEDAPIRQVFKFTKLKGGVFVPMWGVSLDFVPHISGKKVSWHRSNKSARLDLCFHPHGHGLQMPYVEGPAPILRRYKYVIGEAVEEATKFWNMCYQIDALPDANKWLRAYYSDGKALTFYNYTQHFVTVAFLLKRSGRPEEALAELDRQYAEFREPEAWQRLKSLLSE
jgi:hypothetical protein